MTTHLLTPQGTAQAPAPPPIPALPSSPGSSTGSGRGDLTTSARLPFDPEAIIRQSIPIVGMTLSMVVVIFIGWPIARAYARRLDRRAEIGTVRAADLQPQIRQLQESIDTMAVELERISESQRFQSKLMAERPHALPVEPKRA